MIPATADWVVARPSRPGVTGLAPTPLDPGGVLDVVKIGEQAIGQFLIGEGSYDDWLDPAVTDVD